MSHTQLQLVERECEMVEELCDKLDDLEDKVIKLVLENERFVRILQYVPLHVVRIAEMKANAAAYLASQDSGTDA